jgi:hypothetical protein
MIRAMQGLKIIESEVNSFRLCSWIDEEISQIVIDIYFAVNCL